MHKPSDKLLRAIERLRRRKARRWPNWVRRGVVQYATEARMRRCTWRTIAMDLGMNPETVRRWALRDGAAVVSSCALAPVEVIDVPAAATNSVLTLALTSPTGYRVDGLDVPSAAALLRALS